MNKLNLKQYSGTSEEDKHLLKLEKIIKKGKSFNVFYDEGNPNNKKIHIREVIDGEYIVYKQWVKRKKKWDYYVEHFYYFFLLVKSNYLK